MNLHNHYLIEDYYYRNPDNAAQLYDSIREVLAPESANLSDEEIESLLEERLSGMSLDEIEGFWGNVGNFIKKAAPSAMPIIGSALGTMVGGPVGTAIGARLGGFAGKAIGRGSQAKGTTNLGLPSTTHQTKVATTGTTAINQLGALIQNPAFLQSILGAVMGSAGRKTVNVGSQNKSVPFGAFMNLLGQLASKAATEANEELNNSTLMPNYLIDSEGNDLCDVANPEERAEVLQQLLSDHYHDYQREIEEDEDNVSNWLLEAGIVEEYY